MRIRRLAIALVLVASACSNSEPDQVVIGSSSTTALAPTTTLTSTTTTTPLPAPTTASPQVDGSAEPLTLGEATSFDGLDLPEADFVNIGRPGRGQTEEVDDEFQSGAITNAVLRRGWYRESSGIHAATYDTPTGEVDLYSYLANVDEPAQFDGLAVLHCRLTLTTVGLGSSGSCGDDPSQGNEPSPAGAPIGTSQTIRWDGAFDVVAVDVFTEDGTIVRSNVVGAVSFTSYPSIHGDAVRAIVYYADGSQVEIDFG